MYLQFTMQFTMRKTRLYNNTNSFLKRVSRVSHGSCHRDTCQSRWPSTFLSLAYSPYSVWVNYTKGPWKYMSQAESWRSPSTRVRNTHLYFIEIIDSTRKYEKVARKQHNCKLVSCLTTSLHISQTSLHCCMTHTYILINFSLRMATA